MTKRLTDEDHGTLAEIVAEKIDGVIANDDMDGNDKRDALAPLYRLADKLASDDAPAKPNGNGAPKKRTSRKRGMPKDEVKSELMEL